MIICPFCKKENRDESRFCNHCGKMIVQEDAFDENTSIKEGSKKLHYLGAYHYSGCRSLHNAKKNKQS